jgi:hypothetical protein
MRYNRFHLSFPPHFPPISLSLQLLRLQLRHTKMGSPRPPFSAQGVNIIFHNNIMAHSRTLKSNAMQERSTTIGRHLACIFMVLPRI